MPSRIEQLCIRSGWNLTNQHRVVGHIVANSTDHRVPEDLCNPPLSNDDRIGMPTANRTLRHVKVTCKSSLHDFSLGLACYKSTEHSEEKHRNVNVRNVTGPMLEGQALDQLCERVTENRGVQVGGERLQCSCEPLNVEGAFK